MSRKQWKNVTENLSLQFSHKTVWSQEEVDVPTVDVSAIRSNLPTKTSATRQISDLESIPSNGPFLLNFNNTPYDSTESDLRNFFRAHNVINVWKNEGKRGSGIIEFKDIASLTGALQMNEKPFISRPIRLTIGTKDDLARIQNTKHQSRFQHKTQIHTSSPIEDSDNWRVKKQQTDMPQNQPKDKSYWRDKPISRPTNDEKVSVDSLESWRRPKVIDNNRISVPSRASESQNKEIKPLQFSRFSKQPEESPIVNAPTASESRDSEVSTKDNKKLSIFGDAKPVDTFQKDREIEKKIESRKATVDEVKSDQPSKAQNIWNTKKPQIQTSDKPSSDHLEWREKKAPLTNSNPGRSKVTIDSKSKDQSKASETSMTEVKEASVVKAHEAPLAPIPINFWEERKKSKVVAVVTEQTNNASLPVSKASTVVVVEPSVEASSDHQSIKTIVTTTSVGSSGSNVASTMTSSSAVPPVVLAKQPVIISVNGPFIDPKSSRSSHHSLSDSSSGANYSKSSPTAVPILSNSKANVASSVIDSDHFPTTALSSAVSTTTTTTLPFSSSSLSSSTNSKANVPSPSPVGTAAVQKSFGSQSSWSKGPPKGLIEKVAEPINQ